MVGGGGDNDGSSGDTGGWVIGGGCDSGGDYQGALVVSHPIEGEREDTRLC